ncbi:MAG TPA: DUF1697 domain-containing protein [Solirubrobacterales bacterium]|nr:DUF1697 domain-containing protein [Solirubrobacterales bacterium]
MAAYAAFLRGINVSGRRVKKEELITAFEACGFDEVSTFRASGNVLFEAPGRAKPDAKEIESALEAELGFASQVFIRSAAQLAKVAGAKPFSPKQLSASKGKLQVAFLPKKPTKAKADKALALQLESDPLALGAAELFWLPAAGTQESELEQKALYGLLGPWTMRTVGTVEQIAAKLC